MKDTAECPHCKRAFARFHQHVLVCPHEPGNYARLKAFLHEHSSSSGVIMSLNAYKKTAVGQSLPSATLLYTVFENWSDVAAEFGLSSPTYQRTAPPTRKPLPYTQESTWAELRVWFAQRTPPYLGEEWDMYAKERNDLPSKATIRHRWGLDWAAIVEEFTDTAPYPVRHDEELASNYRPLRIITAEHKNWAEWAIAHISDESERAREWFRLLGLPHPETLGETGD
jgi:hypothetical protein